MGMMVVNYLTALFQVFLQLKRPSDGATSDPVTFDYLPVEAGTVADHRSMSVVRNLF